MITLKEFVRNLELSKEDNSLRFEPFQAERLHSLETTEGDTGIMNFKSLNSFVAGISRQRQEDILNSLLLAQRAATRAFPNDDQIIDWHKKYFEVLETIGWVFENKDFMTFDAKSSLFEIESAILEILSTALTGNKLAVALKTINALKSLGEGDKRFLAFETRTHSVQQGSFQLSVASEDDNTLSIFASVFILYAKKAITKILFFKVGKDTAEFKYAFSKATLNDSVYDKVRDEIKVKLGDISSFVADLEI